MSKPSIAKPNRSSAGLLERRPLSNARHLWMKSASAAPAGENGERDPHHERTPGPLAEAPAVNGPVCACQTLSLINQGKRRGFARY